MCHILFSKLKTYFLLAFALVIFISQATGLDTEINGNKVEMEIGSAGGTVELIEERKLAIGEDLKVKQEENEKRYPRLGFNLGLPNMPGLIPGSNTGPGGGSTSNNPAFGTSNSEYQLGGAATGIGLASTAALVKSGVLGGLTLIKAAILPPLFVGSIIVFLIAGAVFFTYSVFNSGFGSGDKNNFFGELPSPSSIFNRNGYDYYDQQVQPIYQAIDEGYKKFN